MLEKIPDTIHNIELSDICGLWEVIRITSDKDSTALYPWIGKRFKYHFLPELIFLCLKDGEYSHGTWELAEKSVDHNTQFSIILNESTEYRILKCDRDEILLSDHSSQYLLTRRL
jgi:hypothetical protein